MAPTSMLLPHFSARPAGLRSSHAPDVVHPGLHLVLGLLTIAILGVVVASQLHHVFAESRATSSVSLTAGVRPRMHFSLQDECVVIKANTAWTLSGKTASGAPVRMHGQGSTTLRLSEPLSEITVLSE